MNRFIIKILLMCLITLSNLTSCAHIQNTGNEGNNPENKPMDFIHPGILVTADDIARIKTQLENNVYPVNEAFEKISKSSLASKDYSIRGPYEIIARKSGSHTGTCSGHESDFAAAWMQSIMFICTNDIEYGNKALDILYQYATTLKGIDPEDADKALCAGFDSYMIAKSAELLKYSGYRELCGDSNIDQKFQLIGDMLRNVFIPVLDWFYNREAFSNGNWGAVVTRGYMSAGIYLEDKEMFDKAKNFFLSGNDNGCIKNYISGKTGQCQESGRDQTHAQLGLGALAEICEIAYKQNDESLYKSYDNLLLKGFEYTAKYNLGFNVPFDIFIDVRGRGDDQKQISSVGRGNFLPYYEVIYNHYVFRKHMYNEAAWCSNVVSEPGIRPEVSLNGSNLQNTCGSLLFWESR